MTGMRVVVAGGGVAGLETLIALRGLVGERVELTLVAPEDAFGLRALEVFEPFGVGHPRNYPLAEVTADLDAEFRRDAVARVDADARTAHLRSGAELAYDALVRPSARRRTRPSSTARASRRARPRRLRRRPRRPARRPGRADCDRRPPGAAWTLPAYELALVIAAFVGPSAVTVVTPEREPLSAFGPPAANLVRGELAAAGVTLLAGVAATVPYPNAVQLAPSAPLACDRIVHLPLLAGPAIAGLPCDASGFILVDDAFHVRGRDDLFAVGDGTAGAYKQGGLAAQQADVVADQIAARAGAEHPPRPYRPVMRALLRTVNGPRYLRAEPPGGARSAEVSDRCLWWPPSKVAARWLTPWLAARDLGARPLPPPRRLTSGGISRVT